MNSQEIYDKLFGTIKHKKNEYYDLLLISFFINDPLSMCNIGLIYMNYLKDDIKAFKWFEKSYENGCMQGHYNLANIYLKRFSNFYKAEHYYKRLLEINKTNENLNLFSLDSLVYIYQYYYTNNKDNNRKKKEIEYRFKHILYNIKYKQIYTYHIVYILNKDNRYNDKQIEIEIEEYKKFIYENYNILTEYYKNNDEIMKKLDKYKVLSKIYNNLETDECLVCKETLMKTPNGIMIYKCGHAYHYECILKDNRCYLCTNKTVVREANTNDTHTDTDTDEE